MYEPCDRPDHHRRCRISGVPGLAVGHSPAVASRLRADLAGENSGPGRPTPRREPLFTCDRPVGWRVPALSERYPDDASWSAARIESTAGYLATMLRECLDVQRGERVAILKQNHFDIHLLIAGIVRAGAIAVPMNGAFDAGGVSPYLDQVGATILFTDTATLRRLIAEGAGWGVVRTVVIADRPQPAPNCRRPSALCGSRMPCPWSPMRVPRFAVARTIPCTSFTRPAPPGFRKP